MPTHPEPATSASWTTRPGAIEALHRLHPEFAANRERLHAQAQAEDFHQLHRVHVPRSHWRYSDEPMPVEQADNIRRQRERLTRHLAWLAIGLIAATFGSAFL